jgi:hypothetical protein
MTGSDGANRNFLGPTDPPARILREEQGRSRIGRREILGYPLRPSCHTKTKLNLQTMTRDHIDSFPGRLRVQFRDGNYASELIALKVFYLIRSGLS